MNTVKTPCIGICSTTSVGDLVCRGCKRYAFEVINWNAYGVEAKTAVLKRIETLVGQILENKFRILGPARLQAGLERHNVPYDPDLSAWCWLHNLLKKKTGRGDEPNESGRLHEPDDLREYGVQVLAEYAHFSTAELSETVERELLQLCHAHYERYLLLRR